MNLAIITGVGALTEKILHVADLSTHSYTHFTITSLFPFVTQIGRNAGSRYRAAVAIHPFKFSAIEQYLTSYGIDSALFTGDFPTTRLWQARLRPSDADERLKVLLVNSSNNNSQPIRYFHALERFLDECGVSSIFASELFPEFGISEGCATIVIPEGEYLEKIPEIVASIIDALGTTRFNRMRPAQAAIVDTGVRSQIVNLEQTGTDSLILAYGKNERNKVRPVLFKLPAMDFSPALDQPTIGLTTVVNCERAGVKGIVVCSETTVIADKQTTIKAADEAGMFIHAIPFSQLREIHSQYFRDKEIRSASTS